MAFGFFLPIVRKIYEKAFGKVSKDHDGAKFETSLPKGQSQSVRKAAIAPGDEAGITRLINQYKVIDHAFTLPVLVEKHGFFSSLASSWRDFNVIIHKTNIVELIILCQKQDNGNDKSDASSSIDIFDLHQAEITWSAKKEGTGYQVKLQFSSVSITLQPSKGKDSPLYCSCYKDLSRIPMMLQTKA